MATTREQLQRLERQVAQMMAKVDGFNHSAPGGEHHDVGALLHVLKQTKEQIETDTTKVAHEFTKKKEEQAKKKPLEKDFDEVVTKLDSTVEKHGRGCNIIHYITARIRWLRRFAWAWVTAGLKIRSTRNSFFHTSTSGSSSEVSTPICE